MRCQKAIKNKLSYHYVGKNDLILVLSTLKSKIVFRASKKDSIRNNYENETNQIKQVEPNLYELKKQPSYKVGHVLPWCFDTLDKNLLKVSFNFTKGPFRINGCELCLSRSFMRCAVHQLFQNEALLHMCLVVFYNIDISCF